VRSIKYCTVLINCTPLLQDFSGPPVVPKDTLGVHGNFFDFKGSTEQKRLRTPGLFPCESWVLFVSSNHNYTYLTLLRKSSLWDRFNQTFVFFMFRKFISYFLQTTKSDSSKQSNINGHQKKKQDKKDKPVSKGDGAAKPDGSSDPDDVKETPC